MREKKKKLPKTVRHLIRNVPEGEIIRFVDFINSPYFNKRETPKKLVEAIRDAMAFTNNLTESEEMMERYYEELINEYGENRLAKETTYLKKLFYQFISCRQSEKEKSRSDLSFAGGLIFMEAAMERKWTALLHDQFRKLGKKLKNRENKDKLSYKDSLYHFTQYQSHSLLANHETEIDRSKTDKLRKSFKHLNCYYLISLLKLSYKMLANKAITDSDFDFQVLDPVLKYIEENQNAYKDEPSVILYYTRVRFYQNIENSPHLEQLEEFFHYQISSFSPEERLDLYKAIFNYHITKINDSPDNEKFKRELLRHYDESLNNEIILEDGKLSEWDFKNIATLKSDLKEFEQAKEFIEKYRHNLLHVENDLMYNYNLGYLYFNQGRYDEALSELRTIIKYPDTKLYEGTKLLIFRIHYALGNTESSLSSLIKLGRYFRVSKSVQSSDKAGYKKFIRFARQLVRIKEDSFILSREEIKERKEILRKKIENEENVRMVHWLLEQCEV